MKGPQRFLLGTLAFVTGFCVVAELTATPAQPDERPADPNTVYDPALYQALRYRMIGPYRGSRVTAVTGVPSQPRTFYFGGVGGGVWKTTDGGERWRNVSDDYFEAGSMGAVAVAHSDPNVVYAGTGSACVRGNVSPGIGVYKSMDTGESWEHVGLPEAGQIGRIRIHPRDPDRVYVAALGHIFGPNEERGVFRSKDGGESWENVLYISERTGAIDLVMDPSNPRILYATMWTVERKPWTITSGSEESGLYKTTDGGDTWTELTEGLPRGIKGRIGVTVSPAKPKRVWALVEAEEGGVFRSDDGGITFRRINEERAPQSRPFYFMHIYAHPTDENTVFVVTRPFLKSIDGGVTFEPVGNPFGDNHDLWMHPEDPDILILGNDGGAYVTFNNTESWTTYLNQPTAELYHVFVDNQFPYRVYGSQQDAWITLTVPSRTVNFGSKLTHQNLYAVGGMEAGHAAIHPDNPDIVYSGGPSGRITRYDRKTGQFRQIKIYPELGGTASQNLRYRFNWSAPIRLSPHDPNVLYHTSQYVHRSTDEGQSWETISPDLTTNDKSKQGYSGGPVTRDQTTVEVYCVIFAFEESPHEPGVLFAGSDDGLLHLSRDGGANWNDITPEEMPEFGTVNIIELSAHEPGRALVAVHRYRMDDFLPYIFLTNDYGQSWKLTTDGTNGIPAKHFVRSVREDPDRKGLFYAGTEFGMYVSIDDGEHWQSLQLNLPATSITDLRVHQKDLVLSTQGRSFWILDDLTPLHQIDRQVSQSQAHLFEPRASYRVKTSEEENGGLGTAPRDLIDGVRVDRVRIGTDAPDGAIIYSYFAEAPQQAVRLEILDGNGNVVRSFSSRDDPKDRSVVARPYPPSMKPESTFHQAGMNRFVWDLRYPGPLLAEDGKLTSYNTLGPLAVPGTYQVRLTAGEWSQTTSFELLKDPRLSTTQADYQAQFDLEMQVRDQVSELQRTVLSIRDVLDQLERLSGRLTDTDRGAAIGKAADALTLKLGELEFELVATERDFEMERLDHPPKLHRQVVELYNYLGTTGGLWRADARPTNGAYQRFDDLKSMLKERMDALYQILEGELAEFNTMIRDANVPPIVAKKGG